MKKEYQVYKKSEKYFVMEPNGKIIYHGPSLREAEHLVYQMNRKTLNEIVEYYRDRNRHFEGLKVFLFP